MLNGANFFGHVKNMLYLCTVKQEEHYRIGITQIINPQSQIINVPT